MRNRVAEGGYTIIEVMIVLAVSGGLLMSAMLAINGQQQKTQFNTSVREFDTKVSDLINDIETGFYPNGNDIVCNVPGLLTDPDAKPVPSLPASAAGQREQGANQDCVYLGKAVQFYRDSSGSKTKFRVMSIAGKRLDFNGTTLKTEIPSSLSQSDPEPFYIAGRNTGLETGQLINGLEFDKVRYISALNPVAFDDSFQEIAIVTNAALQSQNNTLSNLGNGRAVIAAIAGDTNYNDNIGALSASIASGLTDNSVAQANNGTIICLKHGSRNAAIAIGVRIEKVGSSNVATPYSHKTATELYVDENAARYGCS